VNSVSREGKEKGPLEGFDSNGEIKKGEKPGTFLRLPIEAGAQRKNKKKKKNETMQNDKLTKKSGAARGTIANKEKTRAWPGHERVRCTRG